MIIGVTALAGKISRDRQSTSIVTTNLWYHYDIANSASYTNGSDTVYDISGNGNINLNFIGSPTYDTTGGIKSLAINAPNNDVLRSDSALGISAGAARSFEVWAYIDQQYSYANIIGLGAGSSLAMMDTLVSYQDGKYRAQGHYYGNDNSSAWGSVTTINYLGWNQIVHTYDGTRTYMYVNGAQQGSSYSVALNTTDEQLHVGWGNYSPPDIFTGRIGNVKVYKNYTLSGAQVLQNYNALKTSYGLE